MSDVVIQFKRATASRWGRVNPILKAGEPGLETDTGLMKVGDGSTTWNLLGYRIGLNGIDGAPGPDGMLDVDGGDGTEPDFDLDGGSA